MKNLKRLLGLMAISGFAFGFAGNVKADQIKAEDVCATQGSNASSYVTYVKYDSGADKCYTNVGGAFNDSNVKEGATVYLLKDFALGTDALLNKSGVLDLNGYTLTTDASKGLSVGNGVNLTIKNGTIDATGGTSMITVANTSKTGSLTIDKTVTIDGSNLSQAVIAADSTTKATTININGTWKNIDHELIDCSPVTGTSTILTINLNANVEGAGKLVGIDAGHSVVNVNGGSYIAKTDNVFQLKSGVLNIKDGQIISEADNKAAIYVNASTAATELNISGGTITAKGTDSNAIFFATAQGIYNISKGTFTSGKDDDNKQLPAIRIVDNEFIKKHEGMITGGTFNGGVVGRTVAENGSTYDPTTATTKLVKGTYTTSNGNVTVGATTQEPADTEEPGTTTGDNKPSKNPQTYDGILSYVTLAISSLGALGFATKKVLF